MSTKSITVATRAELQQAVMSYASQGFQTVRDDGTTITLSKRKTFNWVLAIICLFIPIIGWIALAFMIAAAARGSQAVSITLDPARGREAASAALPVRSPT